MANETFSGSAPNILMTGHPEARKEACIFSLGLDCKLEGQTASLKS